MKSDLTVFSVALGRAVRLFCHTNASFKILRATSGGARHSGWSDGGCWMLAAAIQQGWGGKLYALSRTGFDTQHVVARLDRVFIDQDGPTTANTLIRRFEKHEGFPRGSIRLVPFSSDLNGVIPAPEKQEEIIAGICAHFHLRYTQFHK